MSKRPECTDTEFEEALDEVAEWLNFRRKQKGDGIFMSSHETLGVLVEELEEYRDEVHSKSEPSEKESELIDIAVGAIWGIASLRTGKMDW